MKPCGALSCSLRTPAGWLATPSRIRRNAIVIRSAYVSASIISSDVHRLERIGSECGSATGGIPTRS